MRLTVDIKDEKVVDKVIWFLNSLKHQGVEIVKHKDDNYNKYLEKLENLSKEYKNGNREDFQEYIV